MKDYFFLFSNRNKVTSMYKISCLHPIKLKKNKVCFETNWSCFHCTKHFSNTHILINQLFNTWPQLICFEYLQCANTCKPQPHKQYDVTFTSPKWSLFIVWQRVIKFIHFKYASILKKTMEHKEKPKKTPKKTLKTTQNKILKKAPKKP